MEKKPCVGVNNIARKVKEIYVGVDGKARRVKKVYKKTETTLLTIYVGLTEYPVTVECSATYYIKATSGSQSTVSGIWNVIALATLKSTLPSSVSGLSVSFSFHYQYGIINGYNGSNLSGSTNSNTWPDTSCTLTNSNKSGAASGQISWTVPQGSNAQFIGRGKIDVNGVRIVSGSKQITYNDKDYSDTGSYTFKFYGE